jgi:hypothetical protein
MLAPHEVSELLHEAEQRSPGTFRDRAGRVRAGVLSRSVLDALAVTPCRLTELAFMLDRSKHAIDSVLTRLTDKGLVRRVSRGLYSLA